MAGSLRLETIIGQQAQSGVWNAFVQPLGLVVFVTAAFAESGRLPFDLYEAEQELVAGFTTEYSGVKLMLYLTSEFLHMVTAAFLIVILYLGGWHFWGLTGSSDDVTWLGAILRVAVLWAKVLAVILFFMLARWSWPRFRFDQLMNLAWKIMLPLGLVNLVVVAAWAEYAAWVGRGFRAPQWAAMAATGWLAFVGCWIAITLWGPAETDNRPRLEPAPGLGYDEE
jgi:NADH-quinone oxidoreductase subunit H